MISDISCLEFCFQLLLNSLEQWNKTELKFMNGRTVSGVFAYFNACSVSPCGTTSRWVFLDAFPRLRWPALPPQEANVVVAGVGASDLFISG